MNLNTARELKRALRDDVRSAFARTESVTSEALGGASFAASRLRPAAAFGITRRSASQYGIAVRIFEGFERARPSIEARLGTAIKEADIATGVRYAPRVDLHAGSSIGHYRITAGTLGAIVEDDAAYYVLSNNHVLANCDRCELGDPVVVPGPLDAQDQQVQPELAAHLARWIPLGPTGTVDAAVAALTDDTYFWPGWYEGIGTIASKPAPDRYATGNVVKLGRTTGLTRGRVSAYDLDGVAIDYAERGEPARVVVFDGQIEIIGAPDPTRTFSQGGDSGSLIIDADSLEPYALLYGGGPDAQGIDRTVCHFLPGVLGSLGVKLVA